MLRCRTKMRDVCTSAKIAHAKVRTGQEGIHFENVQTALGNFGKQVGIADLALDEEGNRALVAGDGIDAWFSHDEAKRRLALITEICQVPAGDDVSFLAALLEANALGRGTKGASSALDPAGETVVLLSKIEMCVLDIDILADALDRHLEVTEAWGSALDPGEDAEPGPKPAGDEAPPDRDVLDPYRFA